MHCVHLRAIHTSSGTDVVACSVLTLWENFTGKHPQNQMYSPLFGEEAWQQRSLTQHCWLIQSGHGSFCTGHGVEAKWSLILYSFLVCVKISCGAFGFNFATAFLLFWGALRQSEQKEGCCSFHVEFYSNPWSRVMLTSLAVFTVCSSNYDALFLTWDCIHLLATTMHWRYASGA